MNEQQLLAEMLSRYEPRQSSHNYTGEANKNFLQIGGQSNIPMRLGDLLIRGGFGVSNRGFGGGGADIGYSYPLSPTSNVEATVGGDFSLMGDQGINGRLNRGSVNYIKRW